MGIFNTVLRALTWWNSQTLNTQLYTWRKGQKVGEDSVGNIYYQTRDGKRRWVIFKGDMDSTRVAADWHGWLHHTWDQPPTNVPLVHKPWEIPHIPNLTGSDAAYVPPGSIRNAGTSAARADYEAWQPE